MFMIEFPDSSHYATLGVSPEASAAEIRDARDKANREIEQQRLSTSESTKKKYFSETQARINAAGEVLARPAERRRYDLANPDLRFLAIRISAAPFLAERGPRLEWIYLVIRRFLIHQGVEINPLSDLQRDNFDCDENPNGMLDALLDE